MMWGPTQNGPMTHFIPWVIAEKKIVLMWETLEPISVSQKRQHHLVPTPTVKAALIPRHFQLTYINAGPVVWQRRKSLKVCSATLPKQLKIIEGLQPSASSASVLQTLSTEAKETTYGERDVFHISIAVTSIICDSDYFIISEAPTHTHTHLQTLQSVCVCVMLGLVCVAG